MDLWQLHRGDSPLVIDVPHSGTHLPDALASRLTTIARTVPDTDWHVDRLYQFAAAEGATLFCATQSRYVIDLNRDPSGAALYAGADNTELCPTRTFGGEEIYLDGKAPSPAEVADRRATSFAPYHAALAAEIARVRERHGFAVLLDGHSIRANVPRFFAGRLPDLNLGTASGASCALPLQAAATRVLADAEGFTHVVNGRFKGGWVTRHYGQPRSGRTRIAAGNGAGLLHGRSAALCVGRGAGEPPGWRPATPGARIDRVPATVMIRIYTALQRYDAFLVADRLNQAGIKAHVFNQHASSIVGEVAPDVAQPQVWIERECDVERARVVLRDIETAGSAKAEVRCVGCGELSPANFDLCWNCGAAV